MKGFMLCLVIFGLFCATFGMKSATECCKVKTDSFLECKEPCGGIEIDLNGRNVTVKLSYTARVDIKVRNGFLPIIYVKTEFQFLTLCNVNVGILKWHGKSRSCAKENTTTSASPTRTTSASPTRTTTARTTRTTSASPTRTNTARTTRTTSASPTRTTIARTTRTTSSSPTRTNTARTTRTTSASPTRTTTARTTRTISASPTRTTTASTSSAINSTTIRITTTVNSRTTKSTPIPANVTPYIVGPLAAVVLFIMIGALIGFYMYRRRHASAADSSPEESIPLPIFNPTYVGPEASTAAAAASPPKRRNSRIPIRRSPYYFRTRKERSK